MAVDGRISRMKTTMMMMEKTKKKKENRA